MQRLSAEQQEIESKSQTLAIAVQQQELARSSYELKLKLLAENRKAAAKILSQALSRLEANNSIPRIIEVKSRQS